MKRRERDLRLYDESITNSGLPCEKDFVQNHFFIIIKKKDFISFGTKISLKIVIVF